MRLHTALLRHTVLVMAALAVCMSTAATARPSTDSRARPPTAPDEEPPSAPGLIPLTVAEARRLLNARTAPTDRPGTSCTGHSGVGGTRPERAGSTNVPDYPHLPSSPNKVRL